MAGSAKPRRRKAAASSLRYEHRPGRRAAREEKDPSTGDKLFGCLIFLAFAGIFVLIALSSMFWGDDTWQWADDAWPGGTYGFAVFAGALVPCVAALLVRALSDMNRAYWKAHKARAAARALLALLCGTAMLQLISLIFVAQDTGNWGRGPSGPPSWTFRTQPWLWATGLVATVAMTALLITVAVIRQKPRSQADHAPSTNPN